MGEQVTIEIPRPRTTELIIHNINSKNEQGEPNILHHYIGLLHLALFEGYEVEIVDFEEGELPKTFSVTQEPHIDNDPHGAFYFRYDLLDIEILENLDNTQSEYLLRYTKTKNLPPDKLNEEGRTPSEVLSYLPIPDKLNVIAKYLFNSLQRNDQQTPTVE